MRRTGVWLASGCAVLLTACGGTAERSSLGAPEAPTPSPPLASALSPEPSPSPGPGESDVAPLAAKIALAAPAAEVERPDCTRDLTRDQLPAAYREGPAVWLSSAANGPVELRLTEPVALCLHGFRTGEDLAVTVSVGGRSYRTVVRPEEGGSPSVGEEPVETLFGPAAPVVSGEGGGVQTSRMWRLVPPNVPREALAKAGSFQLAAEQGELKAAHGQGVALPDQPAVAPSSPAGGPLRQLVVSGYHPGELVPVGLYRQDPAGGGAELVSRAGEVVMPVSRVAVLAVPEGAAPADGAVYCLAVPSEAAGNCPKV